MQLALFAAEDDTMDVRWIVEVMLGLKWAKAIATRYTRSSNLIKLCTCDRELEGELDLDPAFVRLVRCDDVAGSASIHTYEGLVRKYRVNGNLCEKRPSCDSPGTREPSTPQRKKQKIENKRPLPTYSLNTRKAIVPTAPAALSPVAVAPTPKIDYASNAQNATLVPMAPAALSPVALAPAPAGVPAIPIVPNAAMMAMNSFLACYPMINPMPFPAVPMMMGAAGVPVTMPPMNPWKTMITRQPQQRRSVHGKNSKPARQARGCYKCRLCGEPKIGHKCRMLKQQNKENDSVYCRQQASQCDLSITGKTRWRDGAQANRVA
jgi:hypothetical protein